MDNNSENQGQEQKDFKFIIIGGNEPTLNKEILESIAKSGSQVAVFELTTDEMKFIINSRAQKKAEETSVNYLEDKTNIDRCKQWVKTLIENYVKQNFTVKIGLGLLQQALDGERVIEFNKKTFKIASTLSWKDANELFGTLELFGFVKYTDKAGGLFSLIIKDDPYEVFQNKVKDLKEMLKLSNGKATVLFRDPSALPEDKKTLKSIKTRLTNMIEGI